MMQAIDIMPVLDSIFGGSPFSKTLDSPQAAADAETTPKEKNQPGAVDAILKTIFGQAEDDMTQEELSKKRKKQAEAGNLAASAANGNPGEEFMSAPSASGSGFGLEDIARLFMGGGL